MKKSKSVLFVISSVLFFICAIILIAALLLLRFSAVSLSDLQEKYTPDVIRSNTLSSSSFDLSIPRQSIPIPDISVEEAQNTENPEIIELVEQYPDAIGWLTVEGADISHPFAIGTDNATYIRSALDGSYLKSGTVFIDFRNNRDMSDNLTVFYGHNFKDGTMFSNLSKYFDESTMQDYPDVYVSLPDRTIHYQVWATVIAHAVDDVIFTSFDSMSGGIQNVVDFVVENAVTINSDLSVDGSSRMIALSTCNPLYYYARTVVLCIEVDD